MKLRYDITGFADKARCAESNLTELTTDFGCDEASQMCEVTDPEPAIHYNTQLIACIKAANDEEVSSEPSASLLEWAVPAG